MKRALCGFAILATLATLCAAAPPDPVDPRTIPTIEAFLAEGVGAPHEDAPAEVEQFGRLVGLWRVETEMATRSGGWVESAPGLWAFKYAIGGFAVSDLWYQGAEALPAYMAALGRDYLLTSNRVYEVGSKTWRVAWMANGGGKGAGADFGVFRAELDEGAMVMRSSSEHGHQRVVFSDIGDDSFRWRSEYSQDVGKTWITVMRMIATRVQS